MISHASLGVRSLETSGPFYDAVLAPIGGRRTYELDNGIAYGRATEFAFWIYRVEGARIAGLGSHLAFQAPSREAVHEAFDKAKALGATTVYAAGAHPELGPDYYGAVFLDLDENQIEIIA